MSMFTKFDSTSEGYIPNNKPVPENTYEVNATNSLSNIFPLYNAKDEFIGMEWNYGNAVDIPFEISGNVIDSEGATTDLWEFLESHDLQVTILDHFFNTVTSFVSAVEVTPTSESAIILLELDESVSKTLERGSYFFELSIPDVGITIYTAQDGIFNVR